MTALVGGNRVRLLENGVAFFPALIAAIDGAREEVHLETYIFADDETGRQVAAALSRAARRGVLVRLLVDGFGTPDFRNGLGVTLEADGVHLLVYRPEIVGLMAKLRLRRHRLRRLHRKLVMVDGVVAFVGGINIVDDWDNLNHKAQVPPRFDYAVQVEGPLVGPIHQALHHLWRLVRWSRLGHRPASPGPTACPVPSPVGSVRGAFLIRDNLRHRRDIEEAYLRAIATARESILIANAYFLPGRRFRQALMEAARRGVTVTVLAQGRVEYLLQHYATRSLYRQLLAAGVRIFEYQRSFLHAKVAVIDGLWATVGSSNIDPFSLLLAREANVVLEDAAFATHLAGSLQRAMTEGAGQVLVESLHRQSWLEKAVSRFAYFLVRLAVGMSRYGGSEYAE